jgi:hypothetical protein
VKKVALVFADRVVFTSGANKRLASSACEIASAFLRWPPLRRVLCRQNLLGGSARLRPERGSTVVQAVGRGVALNSGSEAERTAFRPEVVVDRVLDHTETPMPILIRCGPLFNYYIWNRRASASRHLVR